MVQSGDFSVHAASSLQVDERVCAGRENVTRADHIRRAKENNTVSVRMGAGFMVNDDRFAIETNVLEGSEVFICGQTRFGKRSLFSSGLGHPVQNIFVSDDPERRGWILRDQFGERRVSPDMIRV